MMRPSCPIASRPSDIVSTITPAQVAVAGAERRGRATPTRPGRRTACSPGFGQGAEEHLERVALVHDRVGAALERRGFVADGLGEDDDRRPGSVAHDLRQRGQPVDARHREVEDDDVRVQLFGEADGLVAGPGLADDLERVGLRQRRPEQRPHRRGVIDEKDARHARSR